MPERTPKRLDGNENFKSADTFQAIDSSPNARKRKRERIETQHRPLSSPPQTNAQQRDGIPIQKPISNLTPWITPRAPEQSNIYSASAKISFQSKNGESNGNARQPPSAKSDNIANGKPCGNLKARADALRPQRRALPIWSHELAIQRALRQKDILILVGETGSGKSTQVPQMLLQERWFQAKRTSKGDKVGGCIAITEPRRVAATNLARRVAEEMGTTVGGSRGKVGYAVRFDSATGPETMIKFLTEGMLLQEMMRDPHLKQYSAVLVDEVHERGTNVDLVLGFLKRMTVEKEGLRERGGMGLKVCVMSATAEVEKLAEFFTPEEKTNVRNGNLLVNGPHSTNGVHVTDDEASESEWSGFSDVEDPTASKQPQQVNGVDKTEPQSQLFESSTAHPSNVKICYIEGRQYPISINYASEAVNDISDAALRTIFQIHHSEPMPGDILVFLTGQEVVESLENLINSYAPSLSKDVPKITVLPLFAALPPAAQQLVFQPAPKNHRKVVLSTNIAETSVTVSGVRFVIDCGKAKLKSFQQSIGLDSLLVKPISKSAAIQRKGRAGREGPGKCYRLYTEDTYLSLDQNTTPEILRSDLSHAILTMKARGVEDITTFPLLSPPPRKSLEKALLLLLELDALSPSGSITSIGHKMARLPLSAPLSRALLAAVDPAYDCLEETIDIIAALSVENLFLQPTSDEKREAAESARAELVRREGDHLTLLATVRAYAGEESDRKRWCEGRWISHRAMKSVMDVRKQLRALHHFPNGDSVRGLMDSKGRWANEAMIRGGVSAEKAERILKAFLMGFKMNTARLMPDGRYRTMSQGNSDVGIHPSSTLFGRRVECIMYNEFVFTNKAYARGVSAVQMDWVGEVFSAQGHEEEERGGDGGG
ncbi:uncharacterized protein KY384_002612 [Bacidia gigantensis]|uniref:uncharacterized protein n=1 Tax=Bacidia gigantensis TaxID=2732470 RepID=UPI001D04C020|nr:uncharacterized protein KY384_002612 [Bacidia gigantensis]KAG8532735.1 hypothetical protein KY384_002612 [Bacidia gigantensis]